MNAVNAPDDDPLPPVSGWLQRGFQRFLPRYLRRHFCLLGLDRGGFDGQATISRHALASGPGTGCGARSGPGANARRLMETEPDPPLAGARPSRKAGSVTDSGRATNGDRATIVYANHPGWFDPLIAHYLTLRLFPGRQFYAPIDATALQQYQVFGKLGFYGVDLQSATSVAAFLKTSQRILRCPQAVLWLTPEGRFCDPRDQQQPFQPGLAHLCWRTAQSNPESLPEILPLAIEYAFWDQRLPVCLLRFGKPLVRSAEDQQAALSWDKATWAELLERNLRETQQGLASSVISRDPAAFEPLLAGQLGAGGVYDWMRRLKCWLRGQRFRAQHG